jgi:hypothetical protein
MQREAARAQVESTNTEPQKNDVPHQPSTLPEQPPVLSIELGSTSDNITGPSTTTSALLSPCTNRRRILPHFASPPMQEEEGDDDDDDDDDEQVGGNGDSLAVPLPPLSRQYKPRPMAARRHTVGDLDEAYAPVVRPKLDDSVLSDSCLNTIATTVPTTNSERSGVTLDMGDEIHLEPLPRLELSSQDVFAPLASQTCLMPPPVGVTGLVGDKDATIAEAPSDWTEAERTVVQAFIQQRVAVKTLKNGDWPAFLQHFAPPLQHAPPRLPVEHAPHPPRPPDCPFGSFVTSTSLLPPGGYKMRCYGAPISYTVGVAFLLPSIENDEDEVTAQTKTWAWPAGYAAKTEFNIDSRGQLINGREQALVPFSTLAQYNEEYVRQTGQYMVAGRRVDGLQQIPYNEVFLRVGGGARSYTTGVGLPAALLVRTATYEHLVALLRTRARLGQAWGSAHVSSLPLLLVTPTEGVRVLSSAMQRELWSVLAAPERLHPFGNSAISHRTTVDHTDEAFLEQKAQELLDLRDTEIVACNLSPRALARLAGGYGATDDSVAELFWNVLHSPQGGESLEEVVLEGLTAAARANDYHVAKQLLILHALVTMTTPSTTTGPPWPPLPNALGRGICTTQYCSVPRLPAPLDTDRLRHATSSDGLLAVLGAAQVLRVIYNGGAERRTREVISAVDEWVNHGEHSLTYRISSWYEQRAAQGDLKIATENGSNFMAFVSQKAITNRKKFTHELRKAVSASSSSNAKFSGPRFLATICGIVAQMHSPCLRLELLAYILRLDNRYSVARLSRSVELAAICLGISSKET